MFDWAARQHSKRTALKWPGCAGKDFRDALSLGSWPCLALASLKSLVRVKPFPLRQTQVEGLICDNDLLRMLKRGGGGRWFVAARDARISFLVTDRKQMGIYARWKFLCRMK